MLSRPSSVLLDPELIDDWTGPDVVLLVGLDTAGSPAHGAFHAWARELALGNVVLRGVDVPADVPADAWRELVGAMRDNPRVRGAVVRDHGAALFRACGDLLDEREPTVDRLEQVTALRFADGHVAAFARSADSERRDDGSDDAVARWAHGLAAIFDLDPAQALQRMRDEPTAPPTQV